MIATTTKMRQNGTIRQLTRSQAGEFWPASVDNCDLRHTTYRIYSSASDGSTLLRYQTCMPMPRLAMNSVKASHSP